MSTSWITGKWGTRIIVWGALALGWQILASSKGPAFLPTIPAIVSGLGDVISDGYYTTLLTSLKQLVLGFAVTVVVAIPIGVLIGSSRLFDHLASPWVNGLFCAPKEALLPFLIVLFGVGLSYRVVVVLIFAFFFPALNTAAGVRHASRSLLDTARVFHMSRWRTATRVLLPGAGPFVVAGIRLGFGMAVKGMVIAEIWVTLGTGAIMHEAADSRQLGLFFAMALLILVFAAGVSELLSALERFMRRDLTLARRA